MAALPSRKSWQELAPAPLPAQVLSDLRFVADHRCMKLVPLAQREPFAYAMAGAMAQNVYLSCASQGLATVIRAWFDRDALALAMGLQADHQLLLSQTVGSIPPTQAD